MEPVGVHVPVLESYHFCAGAGTGVARNQDLSVCW